MSRPRKRRAGSASALALFCIASLVLSLPSRANATGTLAYDLSVDVSGEPDPVPSGTDLTISLPVTNAGPGPVSGALLSSSTPDGTTFVSASAPGGELSTPTQGATGVVTCMLPNLETGDSITVTVVVRVESAPGDVVEITADVTGPDGNAGDQDPGNNDAATAVPVLADGVADVSVAVEGTGDSAGSGSLYTFVATVSNDSDTAAQGVVLTASTPDGTTFDSAETSQGDATGPEYGEPGDVVVDIGTLEPGSSATVEITVEVDAAAGAALAFEAVVQTATEDPNADNDSASLEVPVVPSDTVTLDWDEPDPSVDLAPPRDLSVTPAPGAALTPRARPLAAPLAAEIPRGTVTGYNVYRATMPGAAPAPGTAFTSVPPSQTGANVPAAPGGTFYVVTAIYQNGESQPSNEATANVPAATVASVKVSGAKIVATGTNFSPAVSVFMDGFPFLLPAKVKKGAKVTQKGGLLSGSTIAAYLNLHPSVLITFRNSNGGVVAYRYPR